MMKKYDSYKASNLSGVGDIPEHWGVRKLKYEASFNDEVLSDKTDDDYEIEYVEISNVQATKGITDTEIMPFKDAPSRARRLVRHGDVIVSTVRTYLRAIAKIENPPSNMVVSTGFAVIRPKGIEYRFAGYLFTSEYIIDEIISKSVGVSYPAINASDLVNIKVVLPPHNEQVSIANFLDDKTSQIDSLIQKKQQMITLLEEEKTAVINDAVTKGLNPDVPMKDSGIEWLGMVPAHWEVKKLKYITTQIIDGAHFTPTYVDEGVPFLRVTDIQSDSINLRNVKRIPIEEHEVLVKRCQPQQGDLLLSKNGTIGITKVIDWDWDFSIFVSLCLIKFKAEAINPYYFSYFFQSDVTNQQIAEGSKKTSVTNLHLEKIKELVISLPSLDEQLEITNFLNAAIGRIQDNINLIRREIELMKEYRTTLISEAVTGKIDVREYQPEPITSTAALA